MSVPWQLPVAAAVGRSVRSVGPAALGYWPVANMNPYQGLLYHQFASKGIGVVPVVSMDEIDELTVGPYLGADTALHVHWTAPVTADAPDEATARLAAAEFISKLDAMKDSGVRLVWTVHNVLPHQVRYQDVEVGLRRDLAARADLLHLMSERTVEAVAGLFEIDLAKSVHVPHPEYRSSYPRLGVGRERSRAALGIPQDQLVVASIGSINRYKGVDLLVAAVDELAADGRDVVALVAGIPGTVESAREIVALAEASRHTRVVARKLSDQEITAMHEAADLVALPYRASLNSGAAILALGFGLPVVAPALPGFTDLISEKTGVLYSEEEGLQPALTKALDLLEADSFSPAAMEETLDVRRPADVSRKLADAVNVELFGRNKPS